MLSQKYKEILFQYSKLIIPIFISLTVGFVGLSVTDTVMVGRLGTQFLAASSFVNAVTIIFFVFSIGFSVAISPIISANFYANKVEKYSNNLFHGLLLNGFISIPLFIIMQLIRINLKSFNQPPEILELANSYMKVIAFGIIPATIKDVLRTFFNGIGKPHVSMFSSISTFMINLVLNYVLIFGKFGFPRLELLGAGIATVTARSIDVILLILFILYSKNKSFILRPFKLSFKSLLSLSKICLPSALQLTFEVGFFATMSVIIGWMGVNSQAAYAIAMNISRITFLVPLSTSIVTSIIIGKYLGQKNNQMIKKTGNFAYTIILGYYILAMIGLFLCHDKMLSIYKAAPDVQFLFENIVLFFLIFQTFDGLNVVGVNILRGMQDTLVPVLLSSVSQWVFGIPLALVLFFSFQAELRTIFAVQAIVFLISSISLYFRFRFNAKLR